MKWFYAEAGQQKGPVSDGEIQSLVQLGVVRDDTLVWHAGLPGWRPWGEVKPPPPPPDPNAVPKELMAPSPGDVPAGTAADPSRVVCSECGRLVGVEEAIPYGGRHVCAACKPRLVQRLQEGAALGTVGSRFITESELLTRAVRVNVGTGFERAWALFREHAGILIGATLVIYLVMGVVGAIPFIGWAIPLFVGGPLQGGLDLLYLRLIRREPASFETAFSGFGPRFVPLMLVQMVQQLVNYVCFAPLMIPLLMLGFRARSGLPLQNLLTSWGVVGFIWLPIGLVVLMYLFVNWAFALRLVIDKGYGFADAMKLSWRVVHKNWFGVFGFLLVGWLISVAGVLLCCVGLVVLGPVGLAMVGLLYDDIFRDLEPRTAGR